MNLPLIRTIIDTIDKPAIFITGDYVIRAVNQTYVDSYGVKLNLGQSKCHEVSHNSATPCERCPLEQCKKSNKNTSVLHLHETGKGHAYCDILMKPLRDENGITIGFLETLEKVNYATSYVSTQKLIGVSEPFQYMLKLLNRSGKSEISVLLQGDTGTGKELAAQAIHQISQRKDKPFVVLECTGVNESLFESELFGHEKGAFTGANTAKKGLVELADGGTLFLDEIGDVPLNLQVKLLRLLETGTYRSVGGLIHKKANFRLIAASHKNLLALMDCGEFRADLYYRIAAFPIEMPLLKARREDIRLLAEYILSHNDGEKKHLAQDALVALEQYSFPGNIRELKNILQKSALISDNPCIELADLPAQFSQAGQLPSEQRVQTLADVEQRYLHQQCQNFSGTADELAASLGIGIRTLYRKLKKYDLTVAKVET